MSVEPVTTNLPDPNELAREIAQTIADFNATTERGQQSAARIIGISDIGGCREFVRRSVADHGYSDEPDSYKAFIGTAVGDYIERAVVAAYPSARRGLTVKVVLPSGISVGGHPDLVLPRGVLDIKTVDGLTAVRRNGPSEQHQYQRHLYAAALIQAGELPPDAWVGNVWFDRSGRELMPYVQLESYDETWLYRADDWLQDVFYAVDNNEEASKDKPIEWCQVACPFFSACRGADIMKDREGGGLLTDPEHLDAVAAYLEGAVLAKQGETMKDDSRRALAGVSGSTGTHMVRWTSVPPSDVPGFTRSGYVKMEVRKLPRAQ